LEKICHSKFQLTDIFNKICRRRQIGDGDFFVFDKVDVSQQNVWDKMNGDEVILGQNERGRSERDEMNGDEMIGSRPSTPCRQNNGIQNAMDAILLF
jgi:hypothetical protein